MKPHRLNCVSTNKRNGYPYFTNILMRQNFRQDNESFGNFVAKELITDIKKQLQI
jgi:hypothetical protein